MSVDLLERETELAVIEELIASGAAGRASVLVIEGPAGIGKTELLAAARLRAEAAGMQVLGARGAEIERSFPFGVVRQLLEPPLVRASASERRRLLSGAAALAEPVLDPAPAPPGGGQAAADALQAMHGLYWLIAGLAERAPLFLCVDDAQWADAASLRCLAYLVRRLEGLAVIPALAVRAGEPGTAREILAELKAEPWARRLDPGPLGQAAVHELVQRRLGADADAEFCLACADATGGNPFMVHELITALSRDGVEPGAAAAAAVRELGPETVSQSVLLRIARLPAGADALARAVAVLGPGAELRHATALAELDSEGTAAAADGLAAAGILAPGRPLEFVHPIVRASIYEETPEARRRLLHGRAARLLAAEGGRADQVAAQLLAAEPVGDPWAAATLRAAADEALARATPDIAALYVARALREPAAGPERAGLLRALVTASFRAGDVALVDGHLEEAVQELVEGGVVQPVDESVIELAAWLIGAGRGDEGTGLLKRAVERAGETGNQELAFRLEAELVGWLQLTPPEARARLDRYAEQVRPGTPAGRLHGALRAWWHTLIGDATAVEAAALAREALEGKGLEGQGPISLPTAQAILALARADDWDGAAGAISSRLGDAERNGSAPAFAGMRWLDAYLSLARGKVRDAEIDAREAIDGARAGGYSMPFPLWSALLIEALIERDEVEAAEAELAETGVTGEVPDLYWLGPLLFARGRLRLAQGRIGEGVDDLLEMGRRYDRDGMRNPAGYPRGSTAAVALAVLGDREQALALAADELERAGRWGAPSAVGRSLRALGLVEGGERGIELLREAAEQLEDSGADLANAYALSDLGAALRRAGKRAEARKPLRQALDLAHRGGAAALATRTRDELAAAGARPRSLVLSGVESLTPSELRVARMAAEGLSNREIAQALFVTMNTVETHLRHVFQKLSVKSRGELPEALG